jgi:hypothetical protein
MTFGAKSLLFWRVSETSTTTDWNPTTVVGGQFKAGWADATTRGQTYSETALAQITWNNLGYRMGKAIGPAADELILEIFEELAELYGTADEAEIFGLAMEEDDESDETEGRRTAPRR